MIKLFGRFLAIGLALIASACVPIPAEMPTPTPTPQLQVGLDEFSALFAYMDQPPDAPDPIPAEQYRELIVEFFDCFKTVFGDPDIQEQLEPGTINAFQWYFIMAVVLSAEFQEEEFVPEGPRVYNLFQIGIEECREED